MNKLGHTQSTIATGVREFPKYNPKEGQSALKNPFNQTLPLKFPKRAVIRHLPSHVLVETAQQPRNSSVRNYVISNRSHFEGLPMPLTQTEVTSPSPQHHFCDSSRKKLSRSGVFGHLARQSAEYPIRLRTYEDIGTVHNERRFYPAQRVRPDPIISGVEEQRHNSSLQSNWREKRRYRDNGAECERTLQNAPKPKRREPFTNGPKGTPKQVSYKEMYLKTRNLK